MCGCVCVCVQSECDVLCMWPALNESTDAMHTLYSLANSFDAPSSALQVLENALLSIRGIVSFTVDMGKSRAIVRARNGVSVHRLVQAVAATSILEAAQVVRDDMGQERTLSFGQTPPGVAASPEGKKGGEAGGCVNQPPVRRPCRDCQQPDQPFMWP
jgi:hypothetical protein